MKIVRTKEQIDALILAITTNRDELPETNFFGESTEGSKSEMTRWVAELRWAQQYNFASNEDSDIGCWLTGEDDTFGTDYGVE